MDKFTKFTLLGVALAASGGAQAWDSRTQFYSPGGAYLGEARTRNNPGIDTSLPPLYLPDPNGFSNAFQRGLELRRLQNEIDREADRGYEAAEYTEDDAAADEILRRKRKDKAHAFARGEMADELRQVEEADRAVDRAREALWARNAELRRQGGAAR